MHSRRVNQQWKVPIIWSHVPPVVPQTMIKVGVLPNDKVENQIDFLQNFTLWFLPSCRYEGRWQTVHTVNIYLRARMLQKKDWFTLCRSVLYMYTRTTVIRYCPHLVTSKMPIRLTRHACFQKARRPSEYGTCNRTIEN